MIGTVRVRDLRKRYGATEAVRGIDLDVTEAEIFGLIGPNGAGKTTAVECILGLREPDAGIVELCGIDARRHPRSAKQYIGAALQTTSLQDAITPREALVLFASFYRAAARPEQLLDRFALTDKADARFDTLSGGQRQRLALALAFVNSPRLVFLDEPTSGLDPHARRELHVEIRRMKDEGHTVVMTTHDLEEAATLCDRIAVIDGGALIATGTPAQLMTPSGARPLVSFETAVPFRAETLSSIPGLSDIVSTGARGSFRADSVNRAVAALASTLDAQGATLTRLQVHTATLEEVFVRLTAQTSRDIHTGGR